MRVLHFNILPNTGIQICRGFRIPDPEKLGVEAEELWEAACREAKASAQRETVRLIADHIACNQSLEIDRLDRLRSDRDGVLPAHPARSTGTVLSADLVIDTHSGAGRQMHQSDRLPGQDGAGLAVRPTAPPRQFLRDSTKAQITSKAA